MRLARHHRDRGRKVVFYKAGNVRAVKQALARAGHVDEVYASLIVEWTRPVGEALRSLHPCVVLGGTGWSLETTLEDFGIGIASDYSIYPNEKRSVGYTMRGCRLRCPFCVVPKIEGKARSAAAIRDIWRGDGWPRDLLLLDNDFFGNPAWRDRIDELRDGGYRVSLTQGINVRTITDEQAGALAGIDLRSTKMDRRRLYTAWDSLGDERRLIRGLHTLRDAGIPPHMIMVYMLIGYAKGETHADREHRRRLIREFGADPYPMPYRRTQELRWYQGWVHSGWDKRLPWEQWKAAKGDPRNLNMRPRKSPVGQETLFDMTFLASGEP